MIEMKLTGAEALAGQLGSIDRKLAAGIVRGALKSACVMLQGKIRAAAPVDTGLLRDSLKVRALGKKGGSYAATVTTDTTRAKAFSKRKKLARFSDGGNYNVFYGGFVELGHKRGRTQVAGKRFIRDTFDANAEAAAAIIETELSAGIEAALQ